MFQEVAYTLILGFPAIMWGGLFGLASLIAAVVLDTLESKWYRFFLRLTVAIALGHGILGMLTNL